MWVSTMIDALCGTFNSSTIDCDDGEYAVAEGLQPVFADAGFH